MLAHNSGDCKVQTALALPSDERSPSYITTHWRSEKESSHLQKRPSMWVGLLLTTSLTRTTLIPCQDGTPMTYSPCSISHLSTPHLNMVVLGLSSQDMNLCGAWETTLKQQHVFSGQLEKPEHKLYVG